MAAGNAKINVIVDGLKQVQALERSLNNISRLSGKINQGSSGAVPVRIEKTTAQLKEAQRASMVKTRNIGDQIERLGAQGLNVDKARAAIKRAQLADSQKLFTLAKAHQESALNTLKTEKFITQEKNRQRQFGSIREMGGGRFGGRVRAGRAGRISQSALIGGGFPLLFGGGPLQALAGGLGGAFGETISPGGGFAGSIAATAAISSIQKATDSVAKLGQAMNPLTMDLQKLTQSMGMAGTPAEKYLQVLEQTQGKQAAFNESMNRMKKIIGEEGVKELQEFGENMRNLTNGLAEFFTRLSAGFAKVLNDLTNNPIIKGIASPLSKTNILKRAELSQDPAMTALLEQRDALTRGKTGGSLGRVRQSDAFKDIQNQIVGLQKANEAAQKLLDTENTRKETLTGSIQGITDQNKFLQDQLTLGDQGARIEQKKLEFAKAQKIEVSDITDKEAERIANAVKLNDKLKEQRQIQEQIQNILAGGMTNAVMGLIEGTKTLGQVLADVAKQLASMFLNRAFMSIFSNMSFGGGDVFAGFNRGPAGETTFRDFATGGYVKSPTMGLIGEAGESEYVIPASKMSGAMSRYSAGARGGAVIPGGSGNSGTVAGSTGNTIVEYTGPTLNFNGDEYVPKSAVPEIIGAAAKRGAQAGKAQVIGSLKNSRSQRASLGL